MDNTGPHVDCQGTPEVSCVSSEMSSKTILYRRARRLRRLTSHEKLENMAFTGLLIGGLASALRVAWYCCSIQGKQLNENDQIISSQRSLSPLIGRAVGLLVCLFWSEWSARPDIHRRLCISVVGTLLVVVSRLQSNFPDC
jgi:hypothetical protein